MDTEILKKRWQKRLVENIGTNSDFAEKISAADSCAEEILGQMKIGDDICDLFENEPITESAQMTAQYKKVYAVTLAYKTAGSLLYNDKSVSEKLHFALDWLCENRYGEKEKDGNGWRSPREYNWWDWRIGTPTALINIMMLMCDELSPQQIKKYLSLFRYLVPEADMTGSNKLNMIEELIGAAILEGDAEGVLTAVGGIGEIFEPCGPQFGRAEGYYPDGSYRFHEHHAMNATYGLDQLTQTAFLISLLRGTEAALTHDMERTAVSWLIDGQMPFVFDGRFMRCIMGRYPDRGRVAGRCMTEAAIDLRDSCTDEEKQKLIYVVKKLTERGMCRDFENILSLSFCREVRRIQKMPYPKAPILDRNFSGIDRAVHMRGGWAAAVAMNSERIAGYECINGCNRNGWYHGDGMTQIMLESDSLQYADGYWSKINPYRVSGVTADTQPRCSASVGIDSDYLSDEAFAGAAELRDENFAAAMCLRSYHNEDGEENFDADAINTRQYKHSCSLRAKKAWFAFDDALLALGCGISANDGFEVETTVDNRRTAGKTVMAEHIGQVSENEETKLAECRWVNYGDMLGYVFLNGGDLYTRLRKGDEEFFELWLSHGKNPTGESYEYIILPEATAEQTAEYAKKPNIEIAANNEKVQCARHIPSGVSAFVFYSAAECGGVCTDVPLIMIMKKSGDAYRVAVCDPTQKLTRGNISFGKRIEITGQNLRVKLAENNGAEIDFSGTYGESIVFEVRF